jgi:hypothetical protein
MINKKKQYGTSIANCFTIKCYPRAFIFETNGEMGLKTDIFLDTKIHLRILFDH